MITNAEQQYFEALDRLKKKRARISLDAVAKEAGNKPSAIRKDRMPSLVNAINKVLEEQSGVNSKSALSQEKQRKEGYREKYTHYKSEYHKTLAKVVSLESQVWELKLELAKARGSKVLDIGQFQESMD